MTRLAWLGAKLALTVAILAVIARYLEFGKVIGRAMAVGPLIFCAASVLALLQIALTGVRWREILRAVRTPDDPLTPTREVQTIIFSAQIVNQILPFLAGDAMRAVLLARRGVSAGTAVESTILDRAFGALALFALVPISLLASSTVRDFVVRPIVVIVTVLIAVALLVVLIVKSSGLNRAHLDWKIGRRLSSKLGGDVFRLTAVAPANVRIATSAMAVHVLGVGIFALLAVSLSLGAHLTEIVALAPLIVLASMFPFAFGGWGVREGFALLAMQRVGVDPTSAVALSLTFGATQLVGALPGIAALMLLPEGRTAVSAAKVAQT